MPAVSRRNPRGGTYIMNNASFGQMMLRKRGLRQGLLHYSRLIAERARLNSLISAAGGEGDVAVTARELRPDDQHLANSYRVVTGPVVVIKGQGGIPGPRMSMRVINTVRYAAAREFGAGGHAGGRGTRDLRRAGEAFGDLAGEAG